MMRSSLWWGEVSASVVFFALLGAGGCVPEAELVTASNGVNPLACGTVDAREACYTFSDEAPRCTGARVCQPDGTWSACSQPIEGDCPAEVVQLPPGEGECLTVGEAQVCGQHERDGTLPCKPGQQVCLAGENGEPNRWGPCEGAVLPAARDRCGVPSDDSDCNGVVNENCPCPYCSNNGVDLIECAANGSPERTLMRCALGCQQTATGASCSLPRDITAGEFHSCVVFPQGQVKCWGDNGLGYEGITRIGSTDTPADFGFVDIGAPVSQIVAGLTQTCALTDSGRVSCWGSNGTNGLGYGDTASIGNFDTPADRGFIELEGTAVQIASGGSHMCAVMADNRLYCWGEGMTGQLGYGNQESLPRPSTTPVAVGNSVTTFGDDTLQVTAGMAHTCALLSLSGDVRCWGDNRSGQLGYGHFDPISAPSVAGSVDIEGSVRQLTAGGVHTCAMFNTGAVRCWGEGIRGENGRGTSSAALEAGNGDGLAFGEDVGETPATAGDLDLGGPVQQISAGGGRGFHTCAVFQDTGAVRCWGYNLSGQLGYGDRLNVGDDETPAQDGRFVDVGAPVVKVAAGGAHTCAILATGAVRCWGYNGYGQLGYGHTNDIDSPALAGDVPLQ